MAGSSKEEIGLKAPEATSANADPRETIFEWLSQARNPTAEEQEKFEKMGWLFLPIEAKSLKQVEKDNPEHFGYISSFLGQGDIPPKMLAAVYPKQPIIDDQSNSNLFTMLRLLEKTSSLTQEQSSARLLMLPVSANVQLDIAYFKLTQKSLLGNSCVCSLDQSFNSKVALVRRRPDNKLCVLSSEITLFNDVKALRSLVFIKK